MIDRIHDALRRANGAIAILLGVALVLTVLFILTDVILRRAGLGSLGGSDEVSGYVMGAVASWGLACALMDRAHVRIDVIRQRLAAPGRAVMDIFAMIVTTGVVLLIAVRCWPVLSKTLTSGARANTSLETPLWIPQGIWFAGWVWFAFTATALSLIAIAYLATGRREAFEATAGIGAEVET
ncbi:TRAP transporter small permease subunit [Falsirhodobacter halotolerans]|uniref:TRAP transporter small permease subunit n=1 Tax=Falsirhodobacter halotolerans TaxID=1146892 RepID=UPI001FD58DFF|nr:TRAP transporter small permease [Falsirhodobacter halotolerans]MCJ8138932.1 TRAP transporter small permease [Falsirhodobacter halotolerans]